MKKTLILSVCTVVFLLGCKNDESYLPVEKAPLDKLENVSSGLDSIYSNALNFTQDQPILYKLGEIEGTKIFTLNSEKTLQDISENLNSEVFKNKTFNLSNNTAFITNLKNPNREARVGSVESVTGLFDTVSIYSDREKELLVGLTNSLLSLQNPEIGSSEIISSFNKNIISSTDLSEEEKIVLLNYSAMYKSFFKFIQDGGIEDIYNSISSTLPTTETQNARTQSCKLNSKDILIGAVYSGVKGAISGALIGGAGGTVTLPGIGTVTGALAGGIFGGASGFTWGVVDGIATGLLSTCFSMISVDSQCKRIMEQLKDGTIQLTGNLISANPNCFQIDKGELYLILN